MKVRAARSASLAKAIHQASIRLRVFITPTISTTTGRLKSATGLMQVQGSSPPRHCQPPCFWMVLRRFPCAVASSTRTVASPITTRRSPSTTWLRRRYSPMVGSSFKGTTAAWRSLVKAIRRASIRLRVSITPMTSTTTARLKWATALTSVRERVLRQQSPRASSRLPVLTS